MRKLLVIASAVLLTCLVARHRLAGFSTSRAHDHITPVAEEPSESYVSISPSGAQKAVAERVIVGKVSRVSDGDTIHVVDGANAKHKIRLLGIDAPESSQAFGQQSTKRLASLVSGQIVKVTYSELDQYGRVLGTVWIGERNINLAMVEGGHAWAYHYNRDPQYAAAQRRAKSRRIGLWANPEAEDPWSFRRGGRTAAPSARSTNARLPPQSQRREYRAGGRLPVSSRIPAPVCDDWPDTGYWLSTNSDARHNRNCENYRKTRGYPCTKSEGRPCGKCGG